MPLASVRPTTESGRAEGVAGLRERIEWLMLFRVVIVTLLLGSAIAVNVNDVTSFSDPSYIAIASLIVGTYLASIAWVVWLRRSVSLVRLAYAQLMGDVVLVFGLVLLTEGVESVFSFLFFLTIFNGAVLLRRPGAIFAATSTSLALSAVAVLQYTELPWLMELFPATVPRSRQVPVYAMTMHLVGFYTVALLSGYLAEQLGRVGTELERRQLDLRELRALMENVVRSVGSGLVALDEEGRVLFGNPAARRILGVDVGGRPGEKLATLHPVLAEAATAAEGEVRAREFEWRHPALPTPRYLSLQVSALQDAEQRRRGRILVIQDQTEVRELQTELTRQAHLAAIGNLSAAIAHEIRNPLAAISGSVELLRSEMEAESSGMMLSEIVVREVERLNKLVTEFLDYARPRPLERMEVDVEELVASTIKVFLQDTSVVGDAMEVELIVEPGERVDAELDGERMRQVFWNLLRNAAQANGGKGTIRVHVRASREPSRTDVVVVTVVDAGEGFREDVLERLFEPFFTTKVGGTGLGLATCQRIVQAHGGAICATNVEGGGAAVMVMVPAGGRMDREPLRDVRTSEERERTLRLLAQAPAGVRWTRMR